MLKRKKLAKKPAKPLDTISGKRGRGRPRRVRPSEIRGRGDNYRSIFGEIWGRLREPLLQVTTEKEITYVFDEYAKPYTQEFVPALNALILKVIRDSKFPKRPEAQIKFIADSLAGYDWVSARRSRDICEQERAKEKRAHHIIRYEFKIECSCGFRGFSRDHACPKCGAKISFGLNPVVGPRFF